MLKYAETDKRGRAIEKAFLEVGKSFLFYRIQQIDWTLYLIPILDILLIIWYFQTKLLSVSNKKGFRKNKMLSDFPEKTSAPVPWNSDLKIVLKCPS